MGKTILDSIYDAVVTVPGVLSFANYKAPSMDNIKTQNIEEAVEIFSNDDIGRIKVHLILINGVNVRDVVKEVQIRVKYELEKLSQFVRNYIIDISVDDIVVL